MNVRQIISDGPMSRLQVAVIAICMVLNMLDGFDVLVVAFTAHDIVREWGLGPAQLGVLFSSGLFGMMLGAFFISPLADSYGRRPVILACLVLTTVGMLASAAAPDHIVFALTRIITGLGIGGMLPSINTMVSEYASTKRRNISLSLMHVGYPLGAIVGGVSAAYLIAAYDWRIVYVFGGAATLLMIPVAYFYLAESLEFLLERRPSNSLERVNALLARLGQAPVAALPSPERQAAMSHAKASNFQNLGLLFRQYLRQSMLLWSAFFLIMFSLYFLLNWTPKILIDSGLSPNQGISAGVLMNAGGIAGMLLLGIVSSRFSLVRSVQAYLVMSGVLVAALGWLALSLEYTLGLVAVVGLFIMGGLIGMYMIGAWIYSAAIRTTGVGWAITFGRIGAIGGPMVAGFLIEAGVSKEICFTIFMAPLLLSALLLSGLKSHNI